MNDKELSEEIRGLIQSSVPDLESLEVLIFLASHPGEGWTVRRLMDAMRPTQASGLVQSLALLREQGLLEAGQQGEVMFQPATPALAAAVAALCRAYNERPVTLIRTLYSIADARKIQAFADAFRIKKNPG